ncbi:hypothetical protein FRC03_010449 [Tulasnella sp. 419]|nr:hypothetical protein FRC03_010449 [Tulasnella sp. 419]
METEIHLAPEYKTTSTPQSPPKGQLNISHHRSPLKLFKIKAKFGKTPTTNHDALLPKQTPLDNSATKNVDGSKSPVKSARSDNSNNLRPNNIKARLHALLDSHHHSSSTSIRSCSNPPILPVPEIPSLDIAPTYLSSDPPPSRQKDPPFLKIRIITWNHGYSLPKGELDVLLGSVPPYEGPRTSGNPDELPEFKLDEEHPYHIVVVAAQECPSQSGMPLALGGGLKLELGYREKRHEKSKHKKEAKEKSKLNAAEEGNADEDDAKAEPQVIVKDFSHITSPNPQSTAPSTPAIPGASLYQQVPPTSTHSFKSFGSQTNQANISAASIGTPHHAIGWSSILEDWFCSGVGSLPGARPVMPKSYRSAGSFSTPPTTPLVPTMSNGSATSNETGAPILMVPPSSSQGSARIVKDKEFEPMKWQVPEGSDIPVVSETSSNGGSQPKSGPYVLHCKERLMAIALYVFVHRDVQHLIEGTSKSSVSTGMLKGRIGNKGGIGISMKVAGTTLLFINAHLAAHEGRSAERLANMAKIKADLQVDTFLAPDDPRTVAEDLTDRFDHSFICGDLNFRLDVSRLHAEWLVAQRHFHDAIKFDQLHRIMENGDGFHGFSEAVINFPPTFKYDIMRTLKRHRSVRAAITDKARKHVRRPKTGEALTDEVISEAVEQDDGVVDIESSSDSDNGEAGDAVSMASSAWTSHRSRVTTDGSDAEDDMPDPLSPAAQNAIANSSTGVTQRLLSNPATLKAKAKLLSLINRTPSPAPSARTEHSTSRTTPPASVTIPQHTRTRSDTTTSKVLQHGSPAKSVHSGKHSLEVPRSSAEGLKPPPMKRGLSTQSQKAKVSEEELNSDEEKGVYDTSSKQRVPSWCDRILFKTAIIPSPEDSPAEESLGRSPTRRFSAILGPFSKRGRRDSSISNGSSDDTHHSISLRQQIAENHEVQQGELGHRPTFSRLLPHQQGRINSPIHQPQPERNSSSGNKATPSSLGTPSSSLTVNGRRRSFSASAATTSSQDTPSQPKLVTSNSFPFNQPLRVESIVNEPSPSPPADSGPLSHLSAHFPLFRWSFASIFGNRDTVHATQTLPSPPVLLPPLHSRGDIVCLTYDTLDDRQMRRLEGRSDHRPVMGNFAIYI